MRGYLLNTVGFCIYLGDPVHAKYFLRDRRDGVRLDIEDRFQFFQLRQTGWQLGQSISVQFKGSKIGAILDGLGKLSDLVAVDR